MKRAFSLLLVLAFFFAFPRLADSVKDTGERIERQRAAAEAEAQHKAKIDEQKAKVESSGTEVIDKAEEIIAAGRSLNNLIASPDNAAAGTGPKTEVSAGSPATPDKNQQIVDAMKPLLGDVTVEKPAIGPLVAAYGGAISKLVVDIDALQKIKSQPSGAAQKQQAAPAPTAAPPTTWEAIDGAMKALVPQKCAAALEPETGLCEALGSKHEEVAELFKTVNEYVAIKKKEAQRLADNMSLGRADKLQDIGPQGREILAELLNKEGFKGARFDGAKSREEMLRRAEMLKGDEKLRAVEMIKTAGWAAGPGGKGFARGPDGALEFNVKYRGLPIRYNVPIDVTKKKTQARGVNLTKIAEKAASDIHSAADLKKKALIAALGDPKALGQALANNPKIAAAPGAFLGAGSAGCSPKDLEQAQKAARQKSADGSISRQKAVAELNKQIKAADRACKPEPTDLTRALDCRTKNSSLAEARSQIQVNAKISRASEERAAMEVRQAYRGTVLDRAAEIRRNPDSVDLPGVDPRVRRALVQRYMDLNWSPDKAGGSANDSIRGLMLGGAPQADKARINGVFLRGVKDFEKQATSGCVAATDVLKCVQGYTPAPPPIAAAAAPGPGRSPVTLAAPMGRSGPRRRQ